MRRLLIFFILASAAFGQNSPGKRPFARTTITFSATPTFDFSQADVNKITLTGNVTSSSITGTEDGQFISITVCQDATGGRTLAWPASFVNPPSIQSAANTCETFSYRIDGANVRLMANSLAAVSGSGTVTSLTVTMPTGFQTSGCTITTSGTCAISMPSGWVAGDILYGNGANSVARLAGATGLLHSNGTTPSWSAVALASADVSGQLGTANGGCGGTTAATCFDAIAPTTTRGDQIVRGASGNVRIAIGTNGSCWISNGVDPGWGSCATGAVSGAGAVNQVTTWASSSSLTGSANFTYAPSTGIGLTIGANGTTGLLVKRFTDTSPSGFFTQFQTNAGSTLYSVDVNGNVTGTSFTATGGCNGGTSGCVIVTQGTAPSLTSNGSITLYAPTSVTDYKISLPASASTGFLRFTNSSNTITSSISAASGVGGCINQLVVTLNDNAAPTCSPVTGAMFGTQSANLVFAGPSTGGAANPAFRALVAADIPSINLASGGSGGVTGVLPYANGGCNASSVSACINGLLPLTTLGDILYENATPVVARLAGNTTTTKMYLSQTGTGAVSAAPAWAQIAYTDLSGTPTLFYQTVKSGGTAQTQRANLNFIQGSNVTLTIADNSGTGATDVTIAASSSAGSRWDQLSNPTANLSLSMGANTTAFTWGAATGTSVNPFTISDTTNNTGTGDLVLINTASGSALKPFRVAALGTANGVEVDTTGLLAAIGTGGIKATTTSLSINTSSPLSGGGAFTGNLTLTCPTCVSSSSSLANNGILIGSGGSQGAATVSGITSDGVSQLTLGVAGTSVGAVLFKNATSGTITLQPVTGALGTVTASLPANTGTIAELNLAQSWTALQTFGTNISIGGVTAGGATGTGNVVFDTSPTLTTASLGSSTATTQSAADNSTKVATTAYVNGITQKRVLGWGFGDVATGSTLTTSEVGYITVPFACTITGYHIMADAGTVTIKTARVNGGTALPTIGSNSISTSGVSLSTGTKVDSTTTSDFTSTSISANDTLGFFITAVATAKQITFQLDCQVTVQ